MANVFSGDSSCKALWRFEAGGLITDSIGTNTLTNSSATEDATNYAEGAGSVATTTSKYLYLPQASMAAGFPFKSGAATPFTLCFRFRPTSGNMANYGKLLCNYVWGSYAGIGIAFRNDNKLHFESVYAASSYEGKPLFTPVANHWYAGSISVNASTKRLLVYIWDSTDNFVACVINLVLTNTPTIANAQALSFGAHKAGTPDNYFIGNLDEVVVFDRAINVSESIEIIDQTYSGTTSAPVYGNDVCYNTGGTATASNENTPAVNAIDNNDSTYWRSFFGSAPVWWKFDCGAGVSKKVRKIRIYSNPVGYVGYFTYQGSNDNSNWTTIAYCDQGSELDTYFEFYNANFYRYHRLYTIYGPVGGNTNVFIHTLTMQEAIEPQILSASALESAEAFGDPEVIGSAAPNSLLPSGIASAEAFGDPGLDLNEFVLLPTGIVSAEALGGPAINVMAVTVSPSGIPTAENFGDTVGGPLEAIQIPPTYGAHFNYTDGWVYGGVAQLLSSGIASAEAFGTLTIVPKPAFIMASGIGSGEVFGTPTINPGVAAVRPAAIASGEAFGAHTVVPGTVSLRPSSIASAEALGAPGIVEGSVILVPAAIATVEAFGVAALSLFLLPTGIATAEAHGTTQAISLVRPATINSGEAFGTPVMVCGAVTVYAFGLESAGAFGTTIVESKELAGLIVLELPIQAVELSDDSDDMEEINLIFDSPSRMVVNG
jgi:hypothetical protein